MSGWAARENGVKDALMVIYRPDARRLSGRMKVS
jgi:hypothetical protein